MDFTAVAPSSIAWNTWQRGQPAARLGESRVVVQTPMAPCRVSLGAQGMQRIDMSFQPVVQIHSEFAAWLCDVDSAAADAVPADWRRGKSQSSSMFRNSFRVTAFTNTPCFDSDGKVSFDLMDANSCACLLELQGCWSTDTRWGLRWKVVQVKFDKSVPAFMTTTPSHTHHDVSDQPVPTAFAFLD